MWRGYPTALLSMKLRINFALGPRLENQLQTQLQLAHCRARVVDLAEGAVQQIGVRIAPIGMVQKIERFEAELHESRLGEVEIFQGRKIPFDYAWADHRVAADVAEGEVRLLDVGTGVEPAEPGLPLIFGQHDKGPLHG
jgi:hypothetical protein